MTSPTRILISGAGIAGPTLAYWLDRRGFVPTLAERAPAPRTGGYMLDFWGVGYDVAERMGLLPTLRQCGYRIEELRIVDDAGRRIAGFDAAVFAAASRGRFVSLLRGDLAHATLTSLETRVETIFDDSITALDEDANGVTVSFERGADRRFELVVGADGLHSNVRHLAFDAALNDETYLGYYTAAFSVDAYPHRDPGMYVSYATPGRQLARYALRDDRPAFFFIFANDQPLASAPHHADGQRAQVRSRFAGAGWECDEILAMLAGADYERRFRSFLEGKQRSAERFAGWFAPRTSLGMSVRNLATNAMGLPVLGGMLDRRAFSDRFELPD